nr:MAG TPA: hypothetical protein [Caudoviricetes sp.]
MRILANFIPRYIVPLLVHHSSELYLNGKYC